MKIDNFQFWIDGYEANVPQRLGSSQVAYELLRALEAIDRKNGYTILLPSNPMADMPQSRSRWSYKILKPKKFWTRFALPLALYSANPHPGLIFSPTHYIPRFSPVKRVVTIFDLSFMHYPESFLKKDLWQLNNWTRFSVNNADHVITISNFSKQDIIDFYKIPQNKITVAYPGFNEQIFKPSADTLEGIPKDYNLMDNYIIYIGTIQPRKNLIRLMEALRMVEGLNLLIVGKTKGEGRGGWMYQDILETPAKLGIEKRVKFLGFVPTSDLAYLLKRAVALIQPSLWEGFGIPVIEAMACGVPVMVANNSCLPETVGGAGLLFDPYSVEDIAKALRKIVSSKSLQKELSRKGLKRSKVFSWKNMAEVVLDSLREVAHG